MPFSEELMNRKDIIQLFGISERTLYEWLKKGILPTPFKINQRNFWKKSEVEECIEKLKNNEYRKVSNIEKYNAKRAQSQQETKE